MSAELDDMDKPIHEVHVIPVDASLTPDEAWAELCRVGTRTTYTGSADTWAVIQCDGVECLDIVDAVDE